MPNSQAAPESSLRPGPGALSPWPSANMSINSHEQPLPYSASQNGQDRVRNGERRSSIFAETNTDGAFPDVDARENPLLMRRTTLERDVHEARLTDEIMASEPFHDPKYWARKTKAFWKLIKPDFLLGHLDWKSTKIVSRTWLGVFICTILMVIRPVGLYIGQAAYLLNICMVIEVPGGLSLAHAFYTSVLDMCFILFAFMTNVIAHAISWRIRGYPTQSELLQDLNAQGLCALDDAQCFMHYVHQGMFLSTKCTVLAIIAMIFSIAICGYFQTLDKAYTPPWILSAICTIITGLYMNMTPTFIPWTYGQVVIKPIGISLALRCLLCAVWFPITSNFKFFSILLGAIRAADSALTKVVNLKTSDLSDPLYPQSLKDLEGQIDSILAQFGLLKLDGLMMRGEIALSRFDPGDLGELRSLTRALVTAMSSLSFFFHQIVEKRDLILSHETSSSKGSSSSVQSSETFRPEDQSPRSSPLTAQSKNHSDLNQDHRTPSEQTNPMTAAGPQGIESPLSSSQKGEPNKHRSRFQDSSPLKQSESVPPTALAITSEKPPKLGWARKNKWLKKRLSKSYAHTGNFEENRFALAEELEWDGMRIENLKALQEEITVHYMAISEANRRLLRAIIAWADEANSCRNFALLWGRSRRQHAANQSRCNENLKSALDELTQVLSDQQKPNFAEWARKFCEPEAVRSRQHYIYALSMDAQYGCAVERVSSCVIKLASYCVLLDKHRPNAMLIFPFIKSMSRSPRFESEYSANDGLGMHDIVHSERKVVMVQTRSPDSLLPRTIFHLAGRQVEKFWSRLTNPNVLFCIKRGVVTSMIAIPFVCRTTIYFAYSQRLLWVPVMTALTVSHHAVDGIYGFVTKLIVTFLGSVLGMLVWYLGDGHGDGNSYGFVAATCFVMTITLYFRHFHKLAIPMGAIVLNVTLILVSGTSWVNVHMAVQDVDIGYGFEVAWKRFVIVIVGLTVAFIGTILPHPTTAKKRVRLILAKVLEEIGDLQAAISTFMMERADDSSVHILSRRDPLIEHLRSAKESLRSAEALTSLIDYEPPLGGVWPKNRYQLLLRILCEKVYLLEDIYYSADRLETSKDMKAILQRTGWMDVELTSSLYAVLVMGSGALATGDPLPSITPGHLSELYSRQLQLFIEHDIKHCRKDLEGVLEDRYVRHDGRLTFAMISNVSAFYRRVDGCLLIIKGLVGEIYAFDRRLLNDEENEFLPLIHGDVSSDDEVSHS